jgi:hypothetical protein
MIVIWDHAEGLLKTLGMQLRLENAKNCWNESVSGVTMAESKDPNSWGDYPSSVRKTVSEIAQERHIRCRAIAEAETPPIMRFVYIKSIGQSTFKPSTGRET